MNRAELGRAAWKVLHLTTLRYPEVSYTFFGDWINADKQTPTPSDREALKSYFHLFARLYPCGECAQEFQALLNEYPPQVSPLSTELYEAYPVHPLYVTTSATRQEKPVIGQGQEDTGAVAIDCSGHVTSPSPFQFKVKPKQVHE